MKLYVGVTDGDWFDFLSSLEGVEEVNFWQPGGNRVFGRLSPGEPFLFKLHSPRNYIVGGGFFAHATLLPMSLAWESFGVKNGATSAEEMRRRIEKYRRADPDPLADYTVGCVLLQSPFFLEERDWIPVPPGFSLNIVQGKTYDTMENTGRTLWERVEPFIRTARNDGPSEVRPAANAEEHRYGEPTIVHPRLGQGSFRIVVTDTYHRRCAVTRERTLPALEAGHIKPYSKSGPHSVNNGLLLRRDLHKLFDAGYVTVTPEYTLEVSRRIKEEFENGRDYYAMHGRQLWVPSQGQLRPRREYLDYHASNVFKG